MPSTIPDLWPERFEEAEERTPEDILKIQATKLAEKTSGLITGEVKSWVVGSDVRSEFNLVASSLNNYRYNLFTVSHGLDLYPVRLLLSKEGGYKEIQAKDEAEFIERLGEILRAETTTRIINSLIQLSRNQ